MAKILITGGSGLLGRAISRTLLELGHQPMWLSREAGQSGAILKFRWDPETNFIDPAALQGVEYVIHLAGAGIVDKAWSPGYRQEIVNSRVRSSQTLYEAITKQGISIKKLVGASAVGYYGSAESEHSYSEDDEAGTDFLASVCKEWESSYKVFAQSGIQTAIVRLGIVLGKDGGAYPKLARMAKLGLGTVLGKGTQYLPWVHLEDAAAIFVKLLFDETLSGTYNAVSSECQSNREFTHQLATSFKRKVLLPRIPAWVLRLVLGERAISLTHGLKINNGKLISSGYHFKFDNLPTCLADLAQN
ncbi:MAG: TIGR01777 family oxidoreductase [bacterium]|nr:TIGR01777 family oxidoreductase [bacterium]